VKEGDDPLIIAHELVQVDFQVNSGNYQGMKKLILCSESELELTTKDQPKTLRCVMAGRTRPNTLSDDLETFFSIFIVTLNCN
jgi:hypothetical protein